MQGNYSSANESQITAPIKLGKARPNAGAMVAAYGRYVALAIVVFLIGAMIVTAAMQFNKQPAAAIPQTQQLEVKNDANVEDNPIFTPTSSTTIAHDFENWINIEVDQPKEEPSKDPEPEEEVITTSGLAGTWVYADGSMTFSNNGTATWTDPTETGYYTWTINESGYINLKRDGSSVLKKSTLRYDEDDNELILSRPKDTIILTKTN